MSFKSTIPSLSESAHMLIFLSSAAYTVLKFLASVVRASLFSKELEYPLFPNGEDAKLVVLLDTTLPS